MVKAYVFIKCKANNLPDVKERLEKIPQVIECVRLVNDYDFVVTVETTNSKFLRPIVTSQIRTIPEVIETMTIICV